MGGGGGFGASSSVTVGSPELIVGRVLLHGALAGR